MSSVSNGLYFLILPLVSVMRVIYRKIHHARYLDIKRNVEKVWGARYTLDELYVSENTVIIIMILCWPQVFQFIRYTDTARVTLLLYAYVWTS